MPTHVHVSKGRPSARAAKLSIREDSQVGLAGRSSPCRQAAAPKPYTGCGRMVREAGGRP